MINREELNCIIKENEQRIDIMELYQKKRKYDPLIVYNLKKRNTGLKHQFNTIK